MDTPRPTLGRIIEFDERSRAYALPPALTALGPRSYTWRVGLTLDQGREGACAGFGWAHALAARPRAQRDVTEATARAIYAAAQLIDPWPGEEPEVSGTSALAAAKAALATGRITGYRWAFTLQDALTAISRTGPAVIGVNWYDGMFTPDAAGRIHPTGPLLGGHQLIATGVSLTRGTVRLHNSWGPTWGRGGECEISVDDFDRLRRENGEVCVPVKR